MYVHEMTPCMQRFCKCIS